MNKHIVPILLVLLAAVLAISACKPTRSADEGSDTVAAENEEQASGEQVESAGEAQESGEGTEALPPTAEDPSLEIATFAGGCFWCMEPPFDKVDGVVRTISGYTGGKEKSPTYKEVSYGKTTHAEAVRVYYNPEKVSYEELLDVFWRNINPTQKNGQFVDIGSQYRTAIYVHDDEQRKLAEQSRRELEASGRFTEPIVTEIESASTFWKAEEYHQDFYKKSPGRYKSYRSGSGRDEFIEKVWGDSE
jgi:methionine-S-sulfoxide reductase